jgi:hypothetical protein
MASVTNEPNRTPLPHEIPHSRPPAGGGPSQPGGPNPSIPSTRDAPVGPGDRHPWQPRR